MPDFHLTPKCAIHHDCPARPAGGFTLIETVVVIVISGIIAGMVAVFLLRPIQGYDALVRRAELVDQAEMALRMMQREIRRALPNSVRIVDEGNGNGRVLEILRSIDGGRYRADPPPGTPSAILNFTVSDTDFDVLGKLLCTTEPSMTGACSTYNSGGYWLVIYNLGQSGADAYAGTDVITAGRTITITSGGASDSISDHVNISAPGFDFALSSPTQRFFIVDTPVSYVCDTSARTLTRYQDHGLVADQTTIDTTAELDALATPKLVADKVSACTMTYQAGTSNRAGLVTLDLTIQDPDTNESVRLLHQVHVDNVP